MTAAVPIPGELTGVSRSASEFVRAPTPQAWLEAAVADVSTLLSDHANCERKAASTALALITRYPDQIELLPKLSKLAREEMRHFEQVLALMQRLDLSYRSVSASRYAGALMAAVSDHSSLRLVDTLIVAAVVEARSCERFAALVPVLPDELAGFYGKLLASEARHFELYLTHAKRVFDACTRASDEPDFNDRVARLVDLDNELILSPDRKMRFHSGVPSV